MEHNDKPEVTEVNNNIFEANPFSSRIQYHNSQQTTEWSLMWVEYATKQPPRRY